MTDPGDALNQYLDSLVTGSESRSIALDPGLVATINRLSELNRKIESRASFFTNLEDTLMHMQTAPQSPSSIAMPGNSARDRSFRAPLQSPMAIRSAHSQRLWLATILIAATLTLTFGLLLRSYMPGWIPGNDSHDRGGLAILAPSTPPVDSSDQVLIDLAIPAETFANTNPEGDRLSFWFTQAVVPANSTHAWPADLRTGHPGIEMQYIQDGTITVSAEGPVQVNRANGTTEQPEAGTDIVLGPGDALIHHVDQPSVWTAGETPVTIVAGYVVAQRFGTAYTPESWSNLSYAFIDGERPIPTDPLHIQIRQVRLEPNASASFEPGVRKLFLLEGGGPGFLGEQSDGSLTLRGVTEPTTIYVLTIEQDPNAAAQTT